MSEQNPPRPTARTPVNSILGGKVKGGGGGKGGRRGGREGDRGRERGGRERRAPNKEEDQSPPTPQTFR